MEHTTNGLDITTLDRICSACLSSDAVEREEAERLLLEFHSKPESWLQVPAILQQTRNDQTKFFAVQILEKLVRNRWASLPPEERTHVRTFVASTISLAAANEEALHANRVLVRKLDAVLIEILKLDWPQDWPDFIDSLLTSSQVDPAQCRNALYILQTLGEEMHLYWDASLSVKRTAKMRVQLAKEFGKVLPLLLSILATVPQLSVDQDLRLATVAVQAVEQYVSWVDERVIYSSGLVAALLPSLRLPAAQPSALRALALVATIQSQDEDDRAIVELAYAVLAAIEQMIPVDEANGLGYVSWRRTVTAEHAMALALLLIHLLGEHFSAFDWTTHAEVLRIAHHYLLELTAHEDDEVFALCMDYFSHFSLFLLQRRDRVGDFDLDPMVSVGLSDFALLERFTYTGEPPRDDEGSELLHFIVTNEQLSSPVFDRLRSVLLQRMVSPTQVIEVDEDGDGEIARAYASESESLSLHAVMRETLVYMSQLSYINTVGFLKSSFVEETTRQQLSSDGLTRLCWMLSAFANRLCELPLANPPTSNNSCAPSSETEWLTEVFNTLIALQDRCKSSEETALVAENGIFLFGRYAALLQQERGLLEMAISRIFQVLAHGDQAPRRLVNAATDALGIISYFCRAQLCLKGSDDALSLVERLLHEQLSLVRQALAGSQALCDVYSCFGAMIRAVWGTPSLERLLASLSAEPNAELSKIMSEVSAAPDSLILRAEHLQHLLRLTSGLSLSLKSFAASQYYHIFSSLPPLYALASDLIGKASSGGRLEPTVGALRLVRKQILVLTACHAIGLASDVSYPGNGEAVDHFVHTLLPSFLTVAIEDLRKCAPELVEVQLFIAIDQVLNHLGSVIPPETLGPLMIHPVIEWVHLRLKDGTLDGLSELRRAAYFVLGFSGSTRVIQVETLPIEQQDQLVAVALSGIAVLNRDVAKNANVLAYHLFMSREGMSSEQATAALDFLRRRSHPFLDQLWRAMTDGQHKNTFENQAPVFCKLWELITSCEVPLFQGENGLTNEAWLRRWFISALMETFPQLKQEPQKCEDISLKLHAIPRSSTEDEDVFALVLQDFFFDLAQFRLGDNSAFLLREKERRAKERETRREAQVSTAEAGRAEAPEVGRLERWRV